MNETPSKQFERIRRLAAEYWQPLISLGAGIPALLNGLKSLGIPVDAWPSVSSTPIGRYWLIGVGGLLFVIFRFPRIAIIITRLILPPHS